VLVGKDTAMTLGERLNNPLNIRFVPQNAWQGQIGSEHGFAHFDTVGSGLRAARKILEHYLARGTNTVEKIIATWAPPNENDTPLYIKQVSEWSGLEPDAVLGIEDLERLIPAMAKKETGMQLAEADIEAMWA
jgi:hypothetical protein